MLYLALKKFFSFAPDWQSTFSIYIDWYLSVSVYYEAIILVCLLITFLVDRKSRLYKLLWIPAFVHYFLLSLVFFIIFCYFLLLSLFTFNPFLVISTSVVIYIIPVLSVAILLWLRRPTYPENQIINILFCYTSFLVTTSLIPFCIIYSIHNQTIIIKVLNHDKQPIRGSKIEQIINHGHKKHERQNAITDKYGIIKVVKSVSVSSIITVDATSRTDARFTINISPLSKVNKAQKIDYRWTQDNKIHQMTFDILSKGQDLMLSIVLPENPNNLNNTRTTESIERRISIKDYYGLEIGPINLKLLSAKNEVTNYMLSASEIEAPSVKKILLSTGRLYERMEGNLGNRNIPFTLDLRYLPINTDLLAKLYSNLSNSSLIDHLVLSEEQLTSDVMNYLNDMPTISKISLPYGASLVRNDAGYLDWKNIFKTVVLDDSRSINFFVEEIEELQDTTHHLILKKIPPRNFAMKRNLSLPNLKTLWIGSNSSREEAVSQIFDFLSQFNFPSLQEISISLYCLPKNYFLQLLNSESIRTLSINYRMQWCDYSTKTSILDAIGLQKIATKLEKLELNEIDRNIGNITPAYFPNLKILSIKHSNKRINTQVVPEFLKKIKKFSNLKELTLHNIKLTDSKNVDFLEILNMLGHLQKLEKLDLSGGYLQEGAIDFSNFPSLNYLTIRDSIIGDSTFKNIKNAKLLSHLNLYSNHKYLMIDNEADRKIILDTIHRSNSKIIFLEEWDEKTKREVEREIVYERISDPMMAKAMKINPALSIIRTLLPSNDYFHHLGSKLSKLKILEIQSFENSLLKELSRNGKVIDAHYFPSLEKLKLSNVKVNKSFLESLSEIDTLKVLVLDKLTVIDDTNMLKHNLKKDFMR